jgi:hypothetical protein
VSIVVKARTFGFVSYLDEEVGTAKPVIVEEASIFLFGCVALPMGVAPKPVDGCVMAMVVNG